MKNECSLPVEFEKLAGHVNYVHQTGANEFHSSCPICGGVPHDKELPNRFVMLLRGKSGKPVAFCRKNGCKWWEVIDNREISPERAEEWRQAQIKAAEEREAYHLSELEKARQQLALLRDEHKWLAYLDVLKESKQAQGYWIQAGVIDPFYWEYWGLGYDPSSTSITIPVKNLSAEVVNIKHRTLKENAPYRYWMEYKTNEEPVFVSNLDIEQNSETTPTIIAEGEKKVAATFITLDSMKWQAYGLPATPSQQMLEAIKARHIYYIADPDMFVPRHDKCGKRLPAGIERIKTIYKARDLRIIRLPYKIDDMINEGHILTDDLRNLLAQARRVN